MGLRDKLRRLERGPVAILRALCSRTARVTTSTLRAASVSYTRVIASAQGPKASPTRRRPRR
jgi:hypothetical protein